MRGIGTFRMRKCVEYAKLHMRVRVQPAIIRGTIVLSVLVISSLFLPLSLSPSIWPLQSRISHALHHNMAAKGARTTAALSNVSSTLDYPVIRTSKRAVVWIAIRLFKLVKTTRTIYYSIGFYASCYQKAHQPT